MPATVYHHPLEAGSRTLDEALRGDGARRTRVGRAGVSVSLVPSGGHGAVLLSLGDGACGVRWVSDAHAADVEVRLGDHDLGAFLAGRVSIGQLVLAGRARYSGPIRSYLAVEPVLLGVLPEAERRRDVPAAAASDGAPSGDGLPDDFWSLRCDAVAKELGGRPVLRDISVGIPEGMITVVLGPSGTGKSVLLRHLIGLTTPDAGRVVVRGKVLSELTLPELLALRRRLGVLFQDGALWSSMTLFDNVALPLRQHTDLSESEIAAEVRGALANVGLGGAEQLLPSALSGGMRKRAGLARALVLDPEIVLVDEPDSGLDPVRTALLGELITSTHRQRGGTYVVISHDVRLTRRIADYVVVLWRGEVAEAGLAGDALNSSNPLVRQFLAGETHGPLGME